ncbi:MAG TPA: response regulator transcription factor [Sphingobium sp.]|nr:response regulator transcription factor [Sphingobium sp.]
MQHPQFWTMSLTGNNISPQAALIAKRASTGIYSRASWNCVTSPRILALPRLLLAEDDPDLGPAMKRALELEGHAVDLVRRGDDVPLAVGINDYSVILLDLGLPHLSGLEALRQVRAAGCHTPVIIITAMDRTIHRIAGLDAGADDYVVKPLDLDELAARVRSQLRRKDGLGSNLLQSGNVMLDLGGSTVHRDGVLLAITPKEFRILALLMRRSGRFVSKADLEGVLYDQEQLIESNTVEVAISALRRKLGRDFIMTARGLGYMVSPKSA